MTVRLGALAGRHPKLVVGTWVVLLLVATVAHRRLGGEYEDHLELPGTSSSKGAEVLEAHGAAGHGHAGQVVFSADSALTGPQRASIEEARRDLGRLEGVEAVSDPLAPRTVAKNGEVAYATVEFETRPGEIGGDLAEMLEAAVAPARRAGVAVDYGGSLGQVVRPKAKDSTSGLIGVVVAVIVLLAIFGSIAGAALPLAAAIIGVLTAVGLLGALAAAIEFGSVAPTLATMMGLGVGIDYALFLTTRFRQLLIDGSDVPIALERTLASSGRAVVVAATTVVIAMLGLYASGIAFIGELGLAAAIGVATGAAAALTLAPALLTWVGRRIDRWQVREPVAEPPTTDGRWHRYTLRLERHPVRFALVGVLALAVLAIPLLSMKLGHIGPGEQPTSYSERRAYDEITEAFGAGTDVRMTIAVELAPGTSPAAAKKIAARLERGLESTPDVAVTTPVEATPDGGALKAQVTPKSDPGEEATAALHDELRDEVVPAALHGSGASGYVTGLTASQLDFVDRVESRLPLIIAVVVAGAFLLLLAAFRSPVLALKAALLNLLSIGASYGILVAVFQWGWGSSLLGVPGKVPIESYVPMIVFAIVFGLSMDYEVFLLSRVREQWLASHDNRASVAAGLGETARVIAAAALIMASVFFSFLLSPSVVIKMIALGLGVSVLIDATVIRLLIVPALMFVFGRANWWSPRLLGGGLSRPAPGFTTERPTESHRREV
jgi:RND superfamily putative drug exporter